MVYTSFNCLKISWITDILGSSDLLSQSQVPRLRFVPHLLQIPLQSSLHRTFIGKLSSSSLQTNWSTSRLYPFIKGSSSNSPPDRPAPQTLVQNPVRSRKILAPDNAHSDLPPSASHDHSSYTYAVS